MEYSKGTKVILTLLGSECYEGIVKSFNKATGRITLDNVRKPFSNKELEGPIHLYVCDVISAKIISDKENTEKTNEESYSPEVTEVKTISHELHSKVNGLLEGYRHIRNTTTNFYCALDILQSKDEIGIIVEDVSKGRFERGIIIAISCNTNVFVFDIEAMGDTVFEKGLRNILESPDIIKVGHDFRLQSDCLLHKHLTNIVNVRDVEAMDIAVLFQKHAIVRKHKRSLSSLVEKYLHFPDVGSVATDWKARPLSSETLNNLVRNVSFLLPLKKAIEEEYLKVLVEVSELYNTSVKESDGLLATMSKNEYVLRPEIQLLLFPKPKK